MVDNTEQREKTEAEKMAEMRENKYKVVTPSAPEGTTGVRTVKKTDTSRTTVENVPAPKTAWSDKDSKK